MSYNFGTKHLTGQQQAIIRQREENDKLIKKQSLKEELKNDSIEEDVKEEIKDDSK